MNRANIAFILTDDQGIRPLGCAGNSEIRTPKLNRLAEGNNLFTLIELLIVIAIIGILAAILLPALKKARDSAMNIECINHLKQTGIILSQYADDQNGWLPGAGMGGLFWGRMLYECGYFDSISLYPEYDGVPARYRVKIMSCPARFARNSEFSINTGTLYHYGLNWMVVNGNNGVKLVSLRYPSSRFMVTDSDNRHTVVCAPNGLTYLDYRHSNGLNLLYIDSHVEYRHEMLPGYKNPLPSPW